MFDFFNMSFEYLLIQGLIFLFIFLLFVLNISSRAKIKKLKKKYDMLMNGGDNLSLEQMLQECIYNVNNVANKNKEIEKQINSIERNLLNCVQKVGVVRFNAFDDVGSDMSYSVALLDSNDNGVVFSGLYSRESSTTYSKPIFNGKSKHALSAEEIKAIDIAQKSVYHK